MSKRSRDVDQSRVSRLAGYSIAANHRPYRCNAIRTVLAFQHRAEAKEEDSIEFDRTLDLHITQFLPFQTA
jgi:hypothetical protein